jgi:hypothetical protein
VRARLKMKVRHWQGGEVFETEVDIWRCDSCSAPALLTGSGGFLPGMAVAVVDNPLPSPEGWFRCFRYESSGMFEIKEPIDYCTACAPDAIRVLSEFNREIYRRKRR